MESMLFAHAAELISSERFKPIIEKSFSLLIFAGLTWQEVAPTMLAESLVSLSVHIRSHM